MKLDFDFGQFSESRTLHWHILEVTDSANGKKFYSSINTLRLLELPQIVKYHKLTISEVRVIKTLSDRNEARAIADEFPFS